MKEILSYHCENSKKEIKEKLSEIKNVNNELKCLNLVSFKLNSPYNHVLYSDCCSAGAPHHPASTNVKPLEDQKSMAHLNTRKEESG